MNQRELVLRMADAEHELVDAVNSIMQKHDLPCFLVEPMMDKIHRQLINGKNGEVAAAEARERRTESEEVK